MGSSPCKQAAPTILVHCLSGSTQKKHPLGQEEEARAAGKEVPARLKGEPPELLADGTHWGLCSPLLLLLKFFPSLAGATQPRAYLHCHQVSFVRTPTPSLGRDSRPAEEQPPVSGKISFSLSLSSPTLRNFSKSYQGAMLGSSLQENSGQQQRLIATGKSSSVSDSFPLLLKLSSNKSQNGLH